VEDDVAEGMGEFLRSRRARLTPKDVGLPDGRRRRTPGLRREEVAELADIGVDWYVRLEQGRAVSPSAATIDALGRALLLDDGEKAHLKSLAHNGRRRAFEREGVPDATRNVVGGMTQPAYVTGRRWDLLAWNAAAVELFGDVFAGDGNVLAHLLLDPAARRLFGAGWEGQARHAVAQFRVAYDLWTPDPAFTDLAERLRRGCPEFDAWWDEHDVAGGGAGRKVLHHPERGVVAYDYATFRVNEDPELRLTVYTAADPYGTAG
jgi:transcriptional regulator with XRE-family HTH domain